MIFLSYFVIKLAVKHGTSEATKKQSQTIEQIRDLVLAKTKDK
ncbi:hypothetical protein DSOL_0914 [Desulfosporosinus metallidurans]|uniref:Uncharacterized protein n=1 Tax=Desulfosporosinus metallidurans TaxID=1888891 RepID=A0A1Q8R0R7_9FIRM|nr:hypothetical protein DSOL_0914 [Desulfosporosinus metallidurans]